jgi:hypothetical protein
LAVSPYNQNIVVENGCNILQINPVREGMNPKRNDAVIRSSNYINNTVQLVPNIVPGFFSGETDQLFEKLGFSPYPFFITIRLPLS